MKSNRFLPALRLNAFLIAFGTMATLAFAKEWDPRNPFLVPDLALSAWLVIAAASPRALAMSALLGGFGASAGILGAAILYQAASGGAGLGLASGWVAAIAGLIASIWFNVKSLPARAYPPF